MISIFNRKKKIIVDCFTSDPIAYQLAPIVRASKTIPDWWKTLENIPRIKTIRNVMVRNHKNMRDCYGFRELYKRGVVLEHWTDIHCEVTKEDYRYFYSSGKKNEEHSKEQYNNAFENFHHIKLTSPWYFQENTGVKFLMLGAEWNNENPNIKFLPGILEFRANRSTNVNIMLTKPENKYTIDIPIGHPLVHIIPLNDDLDIKYKCHLISESEYYQKNISNTSLKGHNELLKLLDRNEDRSKSKCPFNFG
jgi:hypothetical protein